MTAETIAGTLGIQSYCFRGYQDAGGVIEALGGCDVRNIELCGVHLDPSSPDVADELKKYTDAGVNVTAFGVHGIGSDESAARAAFELAQLADFPTLSADLRGEGALETAEALCAEYGKRIAIHNHGRKHRLGSVAALEELFAASSANVGLCLDTAWMLDSGEDPVAVAGRFKDRLYGLHVKDFVFDRAGRPEDVVVGTGNLDLDALTALLVEIDFDGYLTLEFEGDVDDPVPATSQCVDAVGASFAKLTAR
jgi:inosose dehydratase